MTHDAYLIAKFFERKGYPDGGGHCENCGGPLMELNHMVNPIGWPLGSDNWAYICQPCVDMAMEALRNGGRRMTTCYYAHCLAIFDTPQEKRDVATLEAMGFEVYNPNCIECDEGYKAHGMLFFRGLIEQRDVFAFRALPDGRIPAGIANELQLALTLGKPVLELPSRVLGRTIPVEETREYLAEVGQR